MPTPVSQTLDKALSLLTLVVADAGNSPLADLAKHADMPLSTAHRMLATLQRRGFISRPRRGCYLPGPALLRLGQSDTFASVLQRVSTGIISALARRTGLIVHLGLLENDMVTYLVKASARTEGPTREGMQLEAYCSAIGKVLLACQPAEEVERYLNDGPFIALTSTTIVEPDKLRQTLAEVRAAGYALDNGEIYEDMCCLAVPIRDHEGNVCSALSISSLQISPNDGSVADIDRLLPLLREAADNICAKLAPSLTRKNAVQTPEELEDSIEHA